MFISNKEVGRFFEIVTLRTPKNYSTGGGHDLSYYFNICIRPGNRENYK
jgi:hypothetical protein